MTAGELHFLCLKRFWFPQNLDISHPPWLLRNLGAAAIAEELDRRVDQKAQCKHDGESDNLMELHGTPADIWAVQSPIHHLLRPMYSPATSINFEDHIKRRP